MFAVFIGAVFPTLHTCAQKKAFLFTHYYIYLFLNYNKHFLNDLKVILKFNIIGLNKKENSRKCEVKKQKTACLFVTSTGSYKIISLKDSDVKTRLNIQQQIAKAVQQHSFSTLSTGDNCTGSTR